MSKCLRCGAESAWIEGNVKDEPSKVVELRKSLREMIKHAERLEARLIATRTPTRALKKDIAKAKALVGDK